MNKLKRIMLLVFSLTIALSLALVAGGCKGKDKTEKVSITFETNGGAAIAKEEVEKGSEYTLPEPTKEDGEFEGWYLNADFSGEKVEKITPEADTTVYAKWAQLYLLTLDPNGGTLSGGNTVRLKSGANVYNAVKDLQPTKTDAQFGAWTQDGTEISSSLTMPESALTLTAKYKTKYTVEIYKQNAEGTAYEKEEQSVTGYAYAGTIPTEEFVQKGYKLNEKADGYVKIGVISENAAENVFRLYFDRETYSVTFRPNYPDGSVADNLVYKLKYGEGVEVPHNYKADGYYLAGWSTSALGEVEYEADSVSDLIFNKTGSEAEGKNDRVSPDKDLVLYGVWVKGYVDMFGGDDIVFLPLNKNNVVYVCRAGIFLKGNYEANKATFNFRDSSDMLVLEGTVFGDGTFAYANDVRAGSSYALYEVGKGLNSDVSVILDAYNGIVYSSKDADGSVNTSKGTYVIESGLYVTTFTDGELKGQTLHILLTQTTINSNLTDVFAVRNEEEYNMGTLYRSLINNGSLVYYQQAYTLRLNGFGVASFFTGSAYSSYNYLYNKQTGLLTLSSSGSTAGTFRVIELSGTYGYIVYDSAHDTEYKAAEGSATLKVDGSHNATYTDGGTTFTGYYVSSASALGGTLYRVTGSGTTRIFLVTGKSEQIEGEDGKTQTVTTYSFVERAETYAEYYFMNTASVYYAPLFAIDDTAKGRMSVYGYTVSKTFEKISDGTYVLANGKYVYTPEHFYTDNIVSVEPYYDSDADSEAGIVAGYRHYVAGDGENTLYMVLPVNVKTLGEITFGAGTIALNSSTYNVNYWYESKDREGNATGYEEEYTDTEGKATLRLAGGMAFYEREGSSYSGIYSVKDGIMTINVYVNGSTGTLYLEVNEEKKTFTAMQSLSYTMYSYSSNGSVDRSVTLAADGKGGAVYSVTTLDSEGKQQTTTVNGTIEETGRQTSFGSVIYKFVAETEADSFEYIRLQTSSAYLFSKYDGTYRDEYIAEAGILTLDGFGYAAKYVAADGTSAEGTYIVADENVIRLTANNRYYYFDIDGESFTKRGDEYGTYLHLDNGYLTGYYLYFDGYGVLIVRTVKEVDGESQMVDVSEGTYSIDGEIVTLHYTIGAQEFRPDGRFGTVSISGTSYRAFVVHHNEVVSTYINAKDWSVLILDNHGGAVKYSSTGVKDTGSYTLITENMLYFVNGDGSDACIYIYDKEKGTATMQTFAKRGYYTKELESLLFSKYGFAIFNGTTRYYYTIENGNCVIYHQPAEGEDIGDLKVNAYGFVKEEFGTFDKEKEYGGKTYYENSGFALTFYRNKIGSAYDTSYKIAWSQDQEGNITYATFETLTFTPSGADTFNQSCQIALRVNDEIKMLSGYVVKAKKADGTYETYLRINLNLGYYRFDLNMTYEGENEDGDTDSFYEITSMKRIITVYSDSYLTMYYIAYALFGMTNYPNMFGEISLVYEFDKEGQQTISYVNGLFGTQSGLIDVNGKQLTMNKASFEYDEKNGLYVATFKVDAYGEPAEGEEELADDEYTYRLYFSIQRNTYLTSMYGYTVYALTRCQTLTTADGYEVEVERMIHTDNLSQRYPAGSVFNISLKKNGEDVAYNVRYSKDGVWNLVAREYAEDEKTIVKTTYYKVTLTEKSSGTVGEETNVVAPYESATVVVVPMKTLYTEDGSSYIDLNEGETEAGILAYTENGRTTLYVISETKKDGNVLTVSLSDGTEFTVTIGEDGKITVTKVEKTEEE